VRFLITGGAGFIGFALCKKLLDKGHKVDILDDLSRGQLDEDFSQLMQNKNLKLISENLLLDLVVDKISLEYDYIFHFAAIIGVKNVLKAPYKVLEHNSLLTMNSIRIAKKQKHLKKYIFASTSEIYAGTLENFQLEIPTPEGVSIGMTDLNRPRTSYMLSKIYGEALVQYSGIPFIIIRPHNIYGPRMGMSHVVPELLKKLDSLKNNSNLNIVSAEHTRSFCFIDDAIDQITFIAKEDSIIGNTYNIGIQNEEVSILDLAKILLKVTNKNINLIPSNAVAGSPNRRNPNMQKLKKIGGYDPKFSLKDGVTITYEWYKKYFI
jgi:nucleoside-diphosphate-sugar epimerase